MRTYTRRLEALVVATCTAFAVSTIATAQEFNQIPLTDKHVTSFIAAQKDFAPLSGRLLEAGEKPDDALKGELIDGWQWHTALRPAEELENPEFHDASP